HHVSLIAKDREPKPIVIIEQIHKLFQTGFCPLNLGCTADTVIHAARTIKNEHHIDTTLLLIPVRLNSADNIRIWQLQYIAWLFGINAMGAIDGRSNWYTYIRWAETIL